MFLVVVLKIYSKKDIKFFLVLFHVWHFSFFSSAITFATLAFIDFGIFIIFVCTYKSQYSLEHKHAWRKQLLCLSQNLFHFLLIYTIHVNNNSFDIVYTRKKKFSFDESFSTNFISAVPHDGHENIIITSLRVSISIISLSVSFPAVLGVE